MGGVVFMGHMFGSETTKRCRELRNGTLKAGKYAYKKILGDTGEGKFVKFYLLAEAQIIKPIREDLTIAYHRKLEEMKKGTPKEVVETKQLSLI